MASTTATEIPAWRRLPIGVEVNADGAAHARVWAPRRKSVELVTFSERDAADRSLPLVREGTGNFSGRVPGARDGTRYRYRLHRCDTIPHPTSPQPTQGADAPPRVTDPTLHSTALACRAPRPAGP